jgi:hypothetical protein
MSFRFEVRKTVRENIANMAVEFRRMTEADPPTIAEWVNRPHVADVWDECRTLGELRETYLPCIEGNDTATPYLAYLDGVPIGYIQSYVAAAAGDGWWTDEHDPGVCGIV